MYHKPILRMHVECRSDTTWYVRNIKQCKQFCVWNSDAELCAHSSILLAAQPCWGVCPFQALLLLHSFHTRVISPSAEDSSVLNSHETFPMCNTEQACGGSRLNWFVKSSVFRTAVSGFQTCAKQLCVCFSDGDYSLGSPYCFLYYMAYWFCKL